MKFVFEYLITWLSPIIPFTTEEAWQCWKKEVNKNAEESCHLLKRNICPDLWKNQKINDDWEKIYKLRDLFLGIVEQKGMKKNSNQVWKQK